MRRIRARIAVGLMSWLLAGSAAPAVEWDQELSLSGPTLRRAWELSGGGWRLAVASDRGPWLMDFDPSGALVDVTAIEPESGGSLRAARPTPEGGTLLGYRLDGGRGAVIRLAADGAVQWARELDDHVVDVVAEPSGGAYVATLSGAARLDADGEPLWSRRPDFLALSVRHALARPAGGLVLAAWVPQDATNDVTLMFELDANGDLDSHVVYSGNPEACAGGGGGRLWPDSLARAADGDLLIGFGFWGCSPRTPPMHRLVRRDVAGDEQWSHLLTDPDGGRACAVAETNDGILLLGNGPECTRLRAVSPTGLTLWERELGFEVGLLAAADDGGYLLAGVGPAGDSVVVLRRRDSRALEPIDCFDAEVTTGEAEFEISTPDVRPAQVEERPTVSLAIAVATRSPCPPGEPGCDLVICFAVTEDCHDGVDNDADGALDCWDADCVLDAGCDRSDDDDDGHPAFEDCSDVDPESWLLPAELLSLQVVRVPGAEARLTWLPEAEPSAVTTSVDVLGGGLSLLRAAGDLEGTAACLADGLDGDGWPDPAPLVPTGDWYLVRRTNSCGDGPWREPALGPIASDCP